MVSTTRGMYLEMEGRRRSPSPPGFSFSLVDRDEDFAAFASLVTANLFKTPSETAQPFAAVLAAMDPSRAFCLLGRDDGGAPAAAACGYLDASGCGGLYFVAVDLASRGRSFGAAIVGSVLDELERRGARACILQATSMGKPLYEKLGFTDACEVGRFALPEAGEARAAGGAG